MLTRLNIPHTYSPVYSQAYHRVSSTSADTVNMKYIFRTSTGNSTTYGVVSTNYVSPENNSYGEFNPNRILANYITWDYNPFGSGSTFVYNAPNSIMKYKIEYGEQIPVSGSTYYFSSTTNNGGYVQYNFNQNPGFAVGDEVKIVKDATTNASYIGWNTISSISATTGFVTNKVYGSTPTITETGYTTVWRSYNAGLTFTGYALNNSYQHLAPTLNYGSTYALKDTTSKFLTNRDNYYLYTDQSYTLSVLNTGITQPYYLLIKGFSGGSLQSSFQYPLSIPANYIRYDLNIGFANLSNIYYINGLLLQWQPLVHTGLDYYTVDLTTSVVSQLIERKTIYLKKNCPANYTTYILAYLNPRGGFDNLYFNFKSKSKIKFNKDTFNRSYNYNYSVSDFGETTISSNYDELITVVSDFLNSDSEIELYKELINSPVVYLQDEENQRLIPVQITTKELEPLKRENGDLYAVQIQFKYAYKDDNQIN